jgi:Nucleotidyl transferase AbiEii toxin, Type IV TA system
MFSNPHHQRIFKVLLALNAPLLKQHECYFGGGTAIVMQLNEFRESEDIDFLCASAEGYRELRNVVYDSGLKGLFTQSINVVRDPRVDRYGIRTRLEIDGAIIKFEIIREDRIALRGDLIAMLPVEVICKEDLFAEKLLANADRFNDAAVSSRDLLDIAMMIDSWGAVPLSSWDKVKKAYGESAVKAFHKSVALIENTTYLEKCLDKLKFNKADAVTILKVLKEERAKL